MSSAFTLLGSFYNYLLTHISWFPPEFSSFKYRRKCRSWSPW